MRFPTGTEVATLQSSERNFSKLYLGVQRGKERGDFASGTSSKSTKLVHGGLRYLENFEFGLVRESLKERTVQLKSSPHFWNKNALLMNQLTI